MHAAPLSTKEVTMLTRRIATSACALCLIVPALAGAQPSHDPPAATPASPQSTARVMGPFGATTPASPQSTARVVGPSGATTPASPQSTARVMGPSGATTPASPHTTARVMGPSGTTKASPRAAIVTDGDGTNGWRIAAVSEAALFAALALGSALILRDRRAALRMGM
jgi:hypothetical protein